MDRIIPKECRPMYGESGPQNSKMQQTSHG